MDKKLIFLLMLFFLAFSIFTTIVFFNKPLKNFARASQENTVSVKESLIIIPSISSVKADGASKGEVDVFVKSQGGAPMKAKKVSIIASLGDISQSETVTDDNGKATFYITSTTPGLSQIEATVDGTFKLDQKVSIKFE